MLDLTDKQWLHYTVMHPFEGFADMRWKKAGSVKYAALILIFWCIGAVFYHRCYGFQFRVQTEKLFNLIPYILRTIGLFLIWTVGNRAVCTFLDGEGTIKSVFIYHAYALIPYVASLYLEVLLSQILIRDEQIFLTMIHMTGILWSGILFFSATKVVHQYSVRKTINAWGLTILAMLIMIILVILVLVLFQQICVFFCTIYTEIVYRIKV